MPAAGEGVVYEGLPLRGVVIDVPLILLCVLFCCRSIAVRALFGKEGVETSAVIAACDSRRSSSLTATTKNLVESALRATEGCKHVAISIQKASERDRCSRWEVGRAKIRTASSSEGPRVRVREGGREGAVAEIIEPPLPGVAPGLTCV